MDIAIKIALAGSFSYSVIALIFMLRKTRDFGDNPLYARKQGNVKKGLIYAFGKGMTPWEKESAKNHLLTYLVGVIYHIGIFITLFFLMMMVLNFRLPVFTVYILRYGSLIGLICGLGLFIKRLFVSHLRGISDPDDYISNLLVNSFLLFGSLTTFSSSYLLPFSIISIVMFLYIPMGKIRHCAFFFAVRILFGKFYGRRGVYPTQK